MTGGDQCFRELLPAVPSVGGALVALSAPAGRGGRPALLGAGQLAREGGTSRRVKTSGGSPNPRVHWPYLEPYSQLVCITPTLFNRPGVAGAVL